jgi:hypothetical protein
MRWEWRRLWHWIRGRSVRTGGGLSGLRRRPPGTATGGVLFVPKALGITRFQTLSNKHCFAHGIHDM